MKKIYVLMLFMIISPIIFADDSILDLETQVDELKSQVENVIQINDSLINDNIEFRKSINEQDKIIERLLAIIGIIIAVLGIIFPIMTYITSIRPLINLDKKIKSKFDELQNKYLDNAINDALKEVLSTDIHVRNKGYTTLFNYKYYDFKSHHKKEMYYILTVSPEENTIELMLKLLNNSIDDDFRRYIKNNPTSKIISTTRDDLPFDKFSDQKVIAEFINNDNLKFEIIFNKALNANNKDFLFEILDNKLIEESKITPHLKIISRKILDFPIINKLDDRETEVFKNTRIYKLATGELV